MSEDAWINGSTHYIIVRAVNISSKSHRQW